MRASSSASNPSKTTLFLDEIGAVPPSVQARLLRVLDDDGDYRRLGDDQPQRTDIRLVAATNSNPADLKFDLLARLKLTVQLPPLTERLEDVPLLLRHLLAAKLAEEPRWPRRLSPGFIESILQHTYPANVRELESLLLDALYHSPQDEIELSPEVRTRLTTGSGSGPAPSSVTWPEVEAVLERNEWNIMRSARELGWSRDQLNRTIRRHGKARPLPPERASD
jgi:two-component system nitrogen regulation response regulator GlnG/two-component system response regulator HydG